MSEKRTERPVVTVSRRGADRIRAGHVWVYRSDIVEVDGVSAGALVTVQEERVRSGRSTRLGSALFSTSSEIAVRMLSRGPVPDLNELLRERIRDAIAYRERFVQNSNAYRVVFSEGDSLPGLIVDRYNDILSIQVLTQAMDQRARRELVISELVNWLNPAAIVERVDARVRKLEQLPERDSAVIWEANGAGERATASSCTTKFDMNGVRFFYEALGTQKTGAFLDQRENYAAAAQYGRGEGLDVFCYHGGFALHLARTCQKVTGVDSSRAALEIADKNAALNAREIDWIEANAFDLLRDYSDGGRQYDCVVLDPPAFAKSKRDRPMALRGYKELNLRALKMLRAGGILVTCSCSYHVSVSDLLETLLSAAQDTHRIVRILENRGAAKDHPNVLGIPETAYLKCLIALVS